MTPTDPRPAGDRPRLSAAARGRRPRQLQARRRARDGHSWHERRRLATIGRSRTR